MISCKAQSEDAGSLRATADFLNRVMNKKHFSYEYMKWQYFDNPVGNAIAICAFEAGSIVGHYAAQPIISLIDGRKIRGLFILNAATDPALQGKGILRGIADRVHERAFKEGYRFMIGVGNKSSTPIYTGRFGFRPLGPMDVKLGLGFPKFKQARSYFFERLWDDNSLKWRMNNPDCRYQIVAKDNKTVIYRQNFPFLSLIMGQFDLPTLENHNSTTIHLGLNLFLGIDPCISWDQTKTYINFPEVIKPSPMVVIFRELQGDHIPVEKGNMLLRGIDIDAF